MATSLAEQLRKLATPQSSLFFDSKKRDSILFNAKEAAGKSRETIFEIGLSGLEELIKLNPTFVEFESTLFERKSIKNLERAVESKEVNEKIRRNIRKFMFQSSPYFMLQSCHKCLEWLIRRFHINTFDKDEFLTLILPYHETKIFVRCVQTMKFEPNDKWYFLLNQVQKTGAPLSKAAVFNHGATNAKFLEFICNFTLDAVKELKIRANTLQTIFAFFSTSIIGALEVSEAVSESQIVSILPVLIKAFKSNAIDFVAASFMITAQLVSKARLSKKLLTQLVEKVSSSIHPGITINVVILQVLIFESQGNDVQISNEALDNFLAAKWMPSVLSQLQNDGIPVIVFMNRLVTIALEKIQELTEKSVILKSFCENLTSEVCLENNEAKTIIRSILDSYIFKKPIADQNDSLKEVISLDSDDEQEVVKDEKVKIWFSKFLKQLERQYPLAFDEVVKELMKDNQDISDKKRNALKNVLGFLLKVSCAQGESNIFESLYHHNPNIRSEAVKYLVENFEKINISTECEDLLKDTITERFNDDNPNVLLEVLKFDTVSLIDLIGHDLLIHKLSKILCRCLKNLVKWDKVCVNALNMLTVKDVWNCKDPNRVFLALIPFMFPGQTGDINYVQQILKSDYAKSCEFLIQFRNEFDHKKNATSPESVCNIATKLLKSADVKLPSSESLLVTVTDIFKFHKNISAVHIYYNLITLAYSMKSHKSDALLGQKIVELMVETLSSCKYEQVNIGINNMSNFKLHYNKIPSELVLIVLENVVNGIKFEEKSNSINLLDLTSESCLKLKTFETLIGKYFKCQLKDRSKCNQIIKAFLDIVGSNYEEKVDFLSTYCIGHTVKSSISSITQIQVMQLLAHVLLKHKSENASISSQLFVRVLVSLTSEVPLIRKCGMELIEVLAASSININWKSLLLQLIKRKEEILMDEEQISLAIFNVFAKVKITEKPQLSYVLGEMIEIMTNKSTPIYTVAQLVNLLKHLTDFKLFKEMCQMVSAIIKTVVCRQDSFNKFDEYESIILNLVILKINKNTAKTSKHLDQFELIIETISCHLMVNSNDGKYLTPSILMLDLIDEELFSLFTSEFKSRVLMASVQATSFSDHPLVIQAAGKMFKRIELDGTLLYQILSPMLNRPTREESTKKSKSFVQISAQTLTTVDWRVGIALLELLQNKKNLVNANKLVALQFQILGRCLEFEEQSPLEYTKQMILSLILQCCHKISTDGDAQKLLIDDRIFKVESVMKCIRETHNPQTHHHALLLLSFLATFIPEQVMHNMMTIFTFMGTSMVRHDDSYSFQIIAKIIENVIPTLIRTNKSDQKELQDKVIGVLRIFSDIILDVPEHRRVSLYVKLINTLEPNEYLWMFLGILMESQVANYEKDKMAQEKEIRHDRLASKNDDKSPKRLQVALEITTEFDAKTILETCTKLLQFLKTLPMIIEKQIEMQEKPLNRDVGIFNLETHSENQLRHFKYISLQFINQLLCSTQFVNKIAVLDDISIAAMKQNYQSLILNILLYVPEITKGVEYFQHKTVEKSWRIMLHIVFDILESTISLLPADMLLMVVQNLIRYKFVMVRRKVIELLINKLETNYFNECSPENMLKLLEPLCEICETIDNQKTLQLTATQSEIETIQQLSLISLKLLARRLAAENVADFKVVLNLLTKSIQHHNSIKINVLVNLLTCIAELTVDLKVHAIGFLAKFMPSFLLLLNVKVTDVGLLTLLNSTVCSVLRIIETLPLFLSPYLDELILHLAKISPGLQALKSGDAKVTTILSRIAKIWSAMSRLIPTRVLIPAIDCSYTKLIRKKNYMSIEAIMELLQQVFLNVDSKEFKNLHGELTEFFLKALQFRCDQNQLDLVDGSSDCAFKDQNESEGFVIKTFVNLILKLSESTFRPLYCNLYEWAIQGDSSTKERTLTFYRLSNEIAGALKSLFVLFATELVQNAAVTLNACNSTKVDGADGLYYANSPFKNLYLVEHILNTLFQIYLHDKQNFINTHRFDLIMQPMVDQLENEIILESLPVQELLKGCLSQFAVAASDDILWKQLNYQILLKTRNNNPNIRLFALDTCVSIAKKLGEDFQPLLPETIPFLSELLEDENYKVEQACQKAVQEIEKILGEPLQKYF